MYLLFFSSNILENISKSQSTKFKVKIIIFIFKLNIISILLKSYVNYLIFSFFYELKLTMVIVLHE